MQIMNDYQINGQQNYHPQFRGGRVDWLGRYVLSKRLDEGELKPFIDRFIKTHDAIDYDIVLGGLAIDNPRLDACITYDKNHFRHITEGKFASLYRSPKAFMKRINRQIDKDLFSVATENQIPYTLCSKMLHFFKSIKHFL